MTDPESDAIEAMLMALEATGEAERCAGDDGAIRWRLTANGKRRAKAISETPEGKKMLAKLKAMKP